MSEDFDDAAVHRLINRVYEAALSDNDWNGWLGALAEALHGHSGLLSVQEDRSGGVDIVAARKFTFDDLAEYAAHWHKEDLWAKAALKREQFLCYTDDQIVSESELINSKIYNEYMLPRMNGVRHVVGTAFALDDKSLVTFGVHRTGRDGGFSELERRRVNVILPHLKRALVARSMLKTIDISVTAAHGALDGLCVAIFLVSVAGKVIFMNKAALRLNESRDNIYVHLGGDLKAARTDVSAKLGNAIRLCLAGSNSAQIRLPGNSGGREMQALVSSIGRRSLLFQDHRAAVVVAVSDDAEKCGLPADHLRARFGLTPSEARFLSAFTESFSVKLAAKSCDIGIATARDYLKAAFRKTETRSQAELMYLLGQDIGRILNGK